MYLESLTYSDENKSLECWIKLSAWRYFTSQNCNLWTCDAISIFQRLFAEWLPNLNMFWVSFHLHKKIDFLFTDEKDYGNHIFSFYPPLYFETGFTTWNLILYGALCVSPEIFTRNDSIQHFNLIFYIEFVGFMIV